MEAGSGGNFRVDDLMALLVIASVAALASFTVFVICYYWFRREQRRIQKKFFQAIVDSGADPDDFFLTGSDAVACGELVAQFKVNQGKQVVSLLESDGKRFIHVDGVLTASERARMVRYLKSEGFMS